MIREMKRTDWDDMMRVYSQSIEKGDVSFRAEIPTYEEWDSSHKLVCVRYG